MGIKTDKQGNVTSKLPATLGDAIDAIYEARKLRLEVTKVAENLETWEKWGKEQLLKKFGKAKLSGAKGRIGEVEVTTEPVPTLKDFKKLCAHVRKTGEFDLLYRRVNNEAVRARWENHKKVPGVEAFPVTKISVKKA